jgi:hypothetical protein
MPNEGKKEIELEIAHVLFLDIVGYSKLLISQQSEQLQPTDHGLLTGLISSRAYVERAVGLSKNGFCCW